MEEELLSQRDIYITSSLQPPVPRYHVSRYPVSRYHVSRYHVSRYHVSRYHLSGYHVSRYHISRDHVSCIMSQGVTYKGILSPVFALHYFTTLSALALPFLPLISALTFRTHPQPSSLSLALGPCHLYPDHYFSCHITPALSPLCLGPLCPKPLCPQPF